MFYANTLTQKTDQKIYIILYYITLITSYYYNTTIKKKKLCKLKSVIKQQVFFYENKEIL